MAKLITHASTQSSAQSASHGERAAEIAGVLKSLLYGTFLMIAMVLIGVSALRVVRLTPATVLRQT